MPEIESIKATVNKRAKFAYECVKNVKENKDKKVGSYYKSNSKRLMALIKTNGLAMTLAFMKSSKNKSNGEAGEAYNLLYGDIDNWLKSPDCPVNALYNKYQEKDMVERVVSFDSYYYRIITKEVMEFINWVRRFAEGMIIDDSDSKN
ncbi:type III-B CRISPR module-associated protein Cmr5 [Thermoanaerobacterium sp. CMT5567-10]|uniref:type III-B CRISPR module-associated protein Cmr5 n=1 Tax=Thermoanaerobacterium sp. CMT5567-10 TaxID=3061989 RepID=UPI0026E05080|nr:type III-B CRISPR module-associated protein Cmr5 [Thermoanaerobacterium sp. CMT5567-10]WKV08542.1 type III-B CRISPR module-associated protein Cmr5 [Thermoanaerobacterium sp. CMT5567-10]